MSIKKRSLTLTAAAAVTALALAGCAADTGNNDNGSNEPGDETKTYTIGVTQIVQHPALDSTLVGFKKALEDNGIEVKYDEQNAQNEASNAAAIAGKFVSDNVDLILAIATPTAQAAVAATNEIPVLFTAVTDAVDAGLVTSNESPGANVTGVTDMTPIKEQLQLAMDIGGAKKVGIIYNSGEANSVLQVKMAEEFAKELGIEIAVKSVSISGDIMQALDQLIAEGIDAYWIPTDNMVVSALDGILSKTIENNIPVYGSEESQVDRGGVATYGINYEQLGYQTGLMAIKILTEGVKPADLPVETQDQDRLAVVLNPAAAQLIGITIPQNILDSADRIVE